MFDKIVHELKGHAPFTALGTLSGVVIMLLFVAVRVPRTLSDFLFWSLHPTHVLLSALVTTAMYRRNTQGGLVRAFIIGYVGSVGIATLSDSIIPFLGELFLNLPNAGMHIGFIEKWWLVNPMAVAGIIIGLIWSRTHIPHAGHIFVSTWASLFHITMALGDHITLLDMIVIPFFLFLAVWLPCCTSDIVFPLLFINKARH